MRWLLYSLVCLLLPLSAQALDTLIVHSTPPVSLQVEVADDMEERVQGMMHRERWAPIDGMLFLFDHPMRPAMWMKDTPLAMDMLFISPDGKLLGMRERAVPFSLERITAPENTLAVLEVPAGFVEKHALKIGDHVEHSAFTH